MIISQGILAQASPTTINDTTLLEKMVSVNFTTIKTIFICNITGGGVTFRIYASTSRSLDYSSRESLFYDTLIAANTTVQIDSDIPLDQFQRIGVRTGTADALVFTAFGEVTDGN